MSLVRNWCKKIRLCMDQWIVRNWLILWSWLDQSAVGWGCIGQLIGSKYDKSEFIHFSFHSVLTSDFHSSSSIGTSSILVSQYAWHWCSAYVLDLVCTVHVHKVLYVIYICWFDTWHKFICSAVCNNTVKTGLLFIGFESCWLKDMLQPTIWKFALLFLLSAGFVGVFQLYSLTYC